MNGHNSEAVVRSSANAELYGLKIIQLFLPLNGHGITLLESLIQKYNTEMPLVNENKTAYLGVGACIGFLISLCYLFKQNKNNSAKEQRLQLFSRLNICAVLFATIGGFSAVIFFAYPFLRGYNRISIFIMFISICVLCEFMQSVWKHEARSKRRLAYVAVFIVLIGICMFDQLPRYGDNDGALEANRTAYASDYAFVQDMEAQLQEDDMVFQLPYHATPEKGPVNNMNDYHLYTGYLHSTSLKWSYGGMAGGESDVWNQYVASLPLKLMVETLVSAGFRGIYIDARAYEAADLKLLMDDIQTLIGVEPSVSDNGNLVFFNLYPYIERNKELLENEPLVIESISTTQYFTVDSLGFIGTCSKLSSEKMILQQGGLQYGPYVSMSAGAYEVSVFGKNLSECNFDVVTEQGTQIIPITIISKNDTEVIYEFCLEEESNFVEMRMSNLTEQDVEFNYLQVTKKTDDTKM